MRSFAFVLVFVALLTVSCSHLSIPSLEKPQCEAARDVVKRLYSFHFGNDMAFNQTNLKAREKFLTADLFANLGTQTDDTFDPFTQEKHLPRAFKLGGCEVRSENSAAVEVQLLWRDEAGSRQKPIFVEAVKSNGEWLVNSISK